MHVGTAMKCEEYADDLADYVDDTLDAVRRRAIDRHVEECDACRDLVADLQTIRAAAFTLDRLEPPAHVWRSIQAKAHTATLDEARGTRGRGNISLTFASRQPVRWLAAAALLVVAMGIGVYSLWTRNQAPAATVAGGGAANPATLVASVEADLQAAEAHYEKAIEGLEQIARSDDETLDPAVAAVLQKNLQVIDQAIDESRAAVRAEPASANAQESLFDAMRNKVALLQQTVELVNEMRKGNQAEAGRIMQGIGKP